ncbi:MAG: M23 family metallopeptidase [Actinomycetales bacterium]
MSGQVRRRQTGVRGWAAGQVRGDGGGGATYFLIAVAGVFAALIALVVFVVSVLGAGVVEMSAVNSCAGGAGSLGATGVPGQVRVPVAGRYRLTSGYGMRTHPVTGQRRLHAGLDLSLQPHGGPVLAMADGQVVRAGAGGNAGNLVALDHGNGLGSRYLHLATISVRVGQQVRAGQQLGTEGATGRVTGPHLHWEVLIGGKSVDPAGWAAQQGLALDGNGPPVSSGAAPAALQGGDTSSSATQLPSSVGRWKGDQLINAGHIIAAGQALGLDAWTITVGVMTAMGESSLINVDRGDAVGPDSRGLFQQRANGAWGSYADRMNPRTAATNFFKALIAVPGYHDLAPTIAAHRTQRNANPYHYQRFWPDAVAVVAALTANPGLLDSLPADGATSVCTDAPVGPLPPAPPAQCPGTELTARSEPGLKPAALRGLRCMSAAFPQITKYHGVGERSLRTSDHPRGGAVDAMIPDYRQPAGKALGWQIAEWTRTNADALDVEYIIFDMKTWSARAPELGWQPYTVYGPNPDDTKGHRDHVHVSYDY